VEELEIDYGGDSVDIGFNVTYLLDVLNNLKCDRSTSRWAIPIRRR
jgi:DNA polymerase-3 subunit beta